MCKTSPIEMRTEEAADSGLWIRKPDETRDKQTQYINKPKRTNFLRPILVSRMVVTVAVMAGIKLMMIGRI